MNYPINTPASGEIMRKRPLYHNLMKVDAYFEQYHRYFDQLLAGYFESGRFERFAAWTRELIAPYVKNDPTAFCSYEDSSWERIPSSGSAFFGPEACGGSWRERFPPPSGDRWKIRAASSTPPAYGCRTWEKSRT